MRCPSNSKLLDRSLAVGPGFFLLRGTTPMAQLIELKPFGLGEATACFFARWPVI